MLVLDTDTTDSIISACYHHGSAFLQTILINFENLVLNHGVFSFICYVAKILIVDVV